MTDKEKLREIKELADAMCDAALYLTNDDSRLRKAMEKYRQFIINEYNKEEPVSEDLQEESKQCKTSNIDFEQELYNHFGQVKDFSCGMRIARYFYEMGRKHQMDGVWHEPSEKPKGDYTKQLLVFTESGYCRVVYYSIRLWNNISKWAYLEDILPTENKDK